MPSVLLRKALADLRGQIAAWGLGMGALLVLTVALFPSISTVYADLFKELPEGFLTFFGGEGLETFEGYMNAEFFSYGPLILTVFAVLAGTAALAGEEGDGTLEVLLAAPTTRFQVAVVKQVALIAGLGGVLLIMLSATLSTMLIINIDASITRLVAAFALLWPFVVAVALAAMLASVIFGGRLLPGTAIAVLIIASYIIQGLAQVVSWLEALLPFLPTSYYQGDEALVGDISLPYTAGLLLSIAVLFALILWAFQRRDIGVRGATGLRHLWPGRAAAHSI